MALDLSVSFSEHEGEINGSSKIINDPVHGHISIPRYCLEFIDTPQFQRLRDLKQLGVTHFIFPGASHHRFEHSIGVSVLANRVITGLKFRQPELQVSDRDIKCVTLAGLCHDLGHGPFSHAFEEWIHRRAGGQSIVRTQPSRENAQMELDANGEIGERGAYNTGNSSSANPNANSGANFSHEAMSLKIIDYMVDSNQIDIERDDVRFVQSLIDGVPYVGAKSELDEGRLWMYDIVANKRNSIDVDKWDYLARDCYGLGVKSSYDHSRLMTYSRVINGEICYHSKEAYNIYEMFHTRYSLFKQVYSHRVGKAIEFMIGDAFDLADDELGISEAVHDVERYTSFLTDNLLRTIESSRTPGLKASRDIIARIRRRDLYKMVDEVLIEPKAFDQYKVGITPSTLAASSQFMVENSASELLDETLPMASSGYLGAKEAASLRVPVKSLDGTSTPPIGSNQAYSILHTYPRHSRRYGNAVTSALAPIDLAPFGPLDESSFRVNTFTCNYAHKDKNPVDSVHFFSKWDDTTSFKLEREKVSLLIPSTFSERYLRVYVTDAMNIPLAQQSFRHLLKQVGDAQPGPQHTVSRTATPAFIANTSPGGTIKRRSSSKSSLNVAAATAVSAVDSPSPAKKAKLSE